MRANVYIDGLNFYYGALKGTPYKWFDVAAFARHLIHRDDELTHVHYFTARVKPSPWDHLVHERQGPYLRALRTLHRVTVHEGSFRQGVVRMRSADAPSKRVEVIKPEEKGSDVHLGARLVADALLGHADRFILVSNDSDFVPAVDIVRHEARKPVAVYLCARHESRELQRVASYQVKSLDKSLFATFQLPDELADDNGTIRKPAAWRQ